MKKLKFILSIAVILAVTFSSCKKEKSFDVEGEVSEISHSQMIVNRIMAFQEQMKSGFKAGGSVSLDSAIWDMEASLNFDYAHPDSASTNLSVQKSYYTLPVDASNNVLLRDIDAVYDLMVDTLQYQYAQINNSYKHVVFSDVKVDTIASGTVFISVKNGFGINPAIMYDPFDADDDWLWGSVSEDPRGKCDGSEIGESDGSDELEKRLNNPNMQTIYQFGFTDIEIVSVNFMNCYYLDPWDEYRVFHDLDYNYCMQNEEISDYLSEYDNIIYTYNDISNDFGSILIEDNEGARPDGKVFIRIEVPDDFSLGTSDWLHWLEISYGIPYDPAPTN